MGCEGQDRGSEWESGCLGDFLGATHPPWHAGRMLVTLLPLSHAGYGDHWLSMHAGDSGNARGCPGEQHPTALHPGAGVPVRRNPFGFAAFTHVQITPEM